MKMVISDIESAFFKKGDVYYVIFENKQYYFLFKPKGFFTYSMIYPLIPLIGLKRNFLTVDEWSEKVKK